MAVSRFSYRLAPEPASEAAPPSPPSPPSPPDLQSALGFLAHERVTQVITLTHGGLRDPDGALSWSRLPGGGTLLCAARSGHEPAGVDVEAVYLPSGTPEFAEFWPIDTWRSRAWRHGEPGPAIPGPDGRLTQERLTAFAQRHASRLAPFLADVRRLFADPAGRQIVLVEQDEETVAHWIALACASLPQEYAGALTFTTRTSDPHSAPQQILGVRPETRLDRDPVALDHLYRVHDGAGGPGSPPADDPWAELTARLWLSGRRPEQPPAGTGDPFALEPLARRLAAEPGGHPAVAELPGGTLRTVVRVLTVSAERARPGTDEFGELVATCRRLAGHCPAEVTDPLALTLARTRLRTAAASGALCAPDAFGGLPLGEGARQALRDEFAQAARDGLWRRLPGPLDGWAGPLRLLLELGAADADPVVADAVAALVQELLRPGGRGRAEAVALLERLGHPELTGRVLERLAAESAGPRIRELRELAAAHGAWLRSQPGEAPLTVRLAEAAARWGSDPDGLDGLHGAALFAKLAEVPPGGRITDPATLRTVCDLVWRGGQPGQADLPEIIRVCPPRLFVEAGLGIRLASWLTAADRVDRELLELARELLPLRDRLTPGQKATAALLLLARDLEQGRTSAAEAVGQVREWMPIARLSGPLRDGVTQMLANGLARTDPAQLDCLPVRRFLATFDGELAWCYQTAVIREYAPESRIRELAEQPVRLASLFHVWCHNPEGCVPEWRQIADDLLARTLGRVVPYLDGGRSQQVAAELRRYGSEWSQAWQDWYEGLRRAAPGE